MMLPSRRKALIIAIPVLLLLAAGFGLLWVKGKNTVTPTPSVTVSAKETSTGTINRKFGLALDSFAVEEQTVQRNETLSDVLTGYGVDPATVAIMASRSKPFFDVRNFRAGNSYSVFCSPDSAKQVRYFVYQPNAIDYVLFDLRDSIMVKSGKRTVNTRVQSVSGVIHGSLYETLENASADPALAVKLANVFAWTIDFYSIQPGDWFKIVYEQHSIKGDPVETGNILSAVFSHKGEEYQAYYFQPDSTQNGDYYDETGKSLRRAFLKAPLKFSHITSRFTMHRFHPVQKRWKAHLGTDYAAPRGTPIISTGNGVVVESRFTRNNGNYVKIRHNGTFTTQYLHMSRRAVRPGQHINQGQVIGYVGSTGLATGPHVCYRFWKNGKQVDPLRQHFPSAEPVQERYQERFRSLVSSRQYDLSSIKVDTPLAIH